MGAKEALRDVVTELKEVREHAENMERHLWKCLGRLPVNMNTSDIKKDLLAYKAYKEKLISPVEDQQG